MKLNSGSVGERMRHDEIHIDWGPVGCINLAHFARVADIWKGLREDYQGLIDYADRLPEAGILNYFKDE